MSSLLDGLHQSLATVVEAGNIHATVVSEGHPHLSATLNPISTLNQNIGQKGGVVNAERLAVEAELLGFEIDHGVLHRGPGRAVVSPTFDAHIGVIDHAVSHRTGAEAMAVFGGVVYINCLHLTGEIF